MSWCDIIVESGLLTVEAGERQGAPSFDPSRRETTPLSVRERPSKEQKRPNRK
jgi:hypothetical protein